MTSQMNSTSERVIRKLDESVVNRIAAGEVVQRPSAAIKEMIENSLDAGATSITITAKGGGVQMLQISDNGCGIRKDDLDIVCERFTTSKLSSFEDLKTISTFGFRGEALASITHVAHVTILTKTKDSPCAYRAKYSDGKLVPTKPGDKAEPKPCAGIVGTTITVEDLFYNMPTRKQAFSKPNEEYQRILDVATKYSIQYGASGVSFTCKKFGQSVPDLHTSVSPGDSSTIECIRTSYGNAVAKELLDIKFEQNWDSQTTIDSSSNRSQLSVCVTGKVSNANYSTKKATYIFFINNRLVECTSMRKTIEAVYQEILPKHSYPFVYLSINMPPQDLDVNVHPTKKEVHFLHEDSLLELIYSELEKCLKSANESRTFQVQSTLSFAPVVADIYGSKGTKSVEIQDTVEGREAIDRDDYDDILIQPVTANFSRDIDRDESNELDGDHSFVYHRSDRTTAEWQKMKTTKTTTSFSDFSVINFDHYSSNSQCQDRKRVRTVEPNIATTTTTRDSSAKRPNERVQSIAPNKMIRTDPNLIKIDSIFKRVERVDIPVHDPVRESSESVDMSNYQGTGTVDTIEEEQNEPCDCDASNQLYCSSDIISSTLQCLCCGVSKRKESLRTVSSTSLSSHNPLLRLPALIETSCTYVSVVSLLDEIKSTSSPELELMLKNHTFVGVIDCFFSLIQHGTRLILVDHSHLLHDMFYQLVIRKFGECDAIVLENTISLKEYIGAALSEETSLSAIECALKQTGIYVSPPNDVDSTESKTSALIDSCVALLIAKGPMLSEYFQICIDAETGTLQQLPMLVTGYTPVPEELPDFLLNLCTKVNWMDELECFRTVALAIADFYSTLSTDTRDSKSRVAQEGTTFANLSAQGSDVLKSLLYPAMKQYLLPHRLRSQDYSVVPIAALEQLYKIFERC